MDLIDRKELLERFRLTKQANGNAIRYEIRCAPTVDAVPVVRCKDCVYFNKDCCQHYTLIDYCDVYILKWPDDYCSWGKRKEPPEGE